jgi:PAS domain S-box-containing protein
VSEHQHAIEAQTWLASIVQSSRDAIISKTPDGTVTSWNPAAEQIYGYPAIEMIGESINRLVPPEHQEEERRVLQIIAAGSAVERTCTRRLRKDGTPVVVSMTMSPIVCSTGDVVGIASISRDLSEQELAEAKFRGLLEAAPDAILGICTTGHIALANEQAERLFGYEREELIGLPVESLVPEPARTMHRQHRSRFVLEPHQRRSIDAGTPLAVRRRDGTEFPAEISLSALETEDGRIVLAAIRDVTERLEAQAERERLKAQAERERLEVQLHQSRRLESLGQLAGGVAHDFNNLLGVILNYAEFVGEDVNAAAAAPGARDWDRVGRDVAQIQRATERAITLTHQLLAFGRRELVRPRVLHLNEVVRGLEELLRHSIGEHVKLSTSLRGDLWPIKADPGQIEQVLVNLAVNARHAMPAGGRLTIETANVTVDNDYAARRFGAAPGNYVRLRVSDTGTGMSTEVLERAFEPFFTTKPKGEGSGLGLATVYGIVAQAGGHVWIDSEPGLGTTVSSLIPVTDETPAVEAQRPVRPVRRVGGETVLLVEDEDAMRDVTERILRRSGYQLVIARHGPQALELAAQFDGQIQLLLTDVIMPQMLGKEVAEQIRAGRPSIRVLYMSGYALPMLTDQGTLDPNVQLIEKPFSEGMLLDAVREVLDAAG